MNSANNPRENRFSSDRPNLAEPMNNSTTTLPTFSTQQLFGAVHEIGIEHEGLLYRLRITKQGKLVLNK